jgi:hypothetical protein
MMHGWMDGFWFLRLMGVTLLQSPTHFPFLHIPLPFFSEFRLSHFISLGRVFSLARDLWWLAAFFGVLDGIRYGS